MLDNNKCQIFSGNLIIIWVFHVFNYNFGAGFNFALFFRITLYIYIYYIYLHILYFIHIYLIYIYIFYILYIYIYIYIYMYSFINFLLFFCNNSCKIYSSCFRITIPSLFIWFCFNKSEILFDLAQCLLNKWLHFIIHMLCHMTWWSYSRFESYKSFEK